jgi:hexosaminidase
MRLLLAAVGLAWFSTAVVAQHSPLLPRPQRVEYGTGSLALSELAIQIQPETATEDRFAASQLAAGILERSGISVPIKETSAPGKTIVFHREGEIEALPRIGEKTGPDSREAYRLSVTKDGVLLRARTSAGLFYAVETLLQIIERSGGDASLPIVNIEDWPAMAYRGTMIDMSEGPLASEAEVFRQLDFLARWKGNQYYFYNEDSIELTGYSLLNPQARFSKAQIHRFVAYARERHIDVVPCLELYGHQHDLFRIEKYSSLADFPHGGEFDPANPEVRKTLADWVNQYIALFPSEFVHIGFDETWEIARAARAKGSGSTPARLFLAQLKTVAQSFLRQNKYVLAWGDIVVKFPDIAAQIPEGVAIVPWWYEPDPDPLYTKWLAPLTANHVPLFVAPGVNMWSEMTPDFDKSFRNLDTFMAAGKRAGAVGVINTVWTDNQEGLRRMAWPGIAYGAVATWGGKPIEKANFFQDYSRLVYPARVAVDIASSLRELSSAESIAQKIWGVEDMDAQWSSPFNSERLATLRKHSEDLRQLRISAEDAQAHLVTALECGANPDSVNALLFGSRVLDYAGMRGLYALEIADLWNEQRQAKGANAELWDLLSSSFSRTHGRIGDIMDALSLLIPEYRANWLAEYSSYRMETALMRWHMEEEFWWRAQSSFVEFKGRYRSGTQLPSMEDLIGTYSLARSR